jgi:HrpA-like RNA helicase
MCFFIASYRSPFISPFDQRDEADASHKKFAVEQSDQLTVLRAYNEWDAIPAVRDKWQFCRDNFLSGKSLEMIAQVCISCFSIFTVLNIVSEYSVSSVQSFFFRLFDQTVEAPTA